MILDKAIQASNSGIFAILVQPFFNTPKLQYVESAQYRLPFHQFSLYLMYQQNPQEQKSILLAYGK